MVHFPAAMTTKRSSPLVVPSLPPSFLQSIHCVLFCSLCMFLEASSNSTGRGAEPPSAVCTQDKESNCQLEHTPLYGYSNSSNRFIFQKSWVINQLDPPPGSVQEHAGGKFCCLPKEPKKEESEAEKRDKDR